MARLGLEAQDTSVEAGIYKYHKGVEHLELRITDGHGNVVFVEGTVESVLMFVDRMNDRVSQWRA